MENYTLIETATGNSTKIAIQHGLPRIGDIIVLDLFDDLPDEKMRVTEVRRLIGSEFGDLTEVEWQVYAEVIAQ